MVCRKCGNEEIIDNDNKLICPVCNDLNILPEDIAIKICEKQSDWFNDAFTKIIKDLEKEGLLLLLLKKRETLCTNFIFETASIHLSDILSINILIKRVMSYFEIEGSTIANEENTQSLITLFSKFIQIQSNHLLINEDLGLLIFKEKFNLESITPEMLMRNFNFFCKEDWFIIFDTYEQNLILTDDSAKEYFEKHEKEYDHVRKSQTHTKMDTPEKKIQILYPTFKALRAGLLRNKLFFDIFNPDYLKEKKIHINIFPRLMKQFKFNQENMSINTSKQFDRLLRRKFKDYDKFELYNALVFSKNNQNIFPLFVELYDEIYTSLNFTYFMELFYFSFFYNNLYNQETQRQSLIFEKSTVPKYFKDNGFKVKINIKDKKKNPTLEIDNLALKNNILFVVEIKEWDIKPFFEMKKIHDNMKRDLEGIVDGKKYTTRNDILESKDIPSLIRKIKYVENNIKLLCPKYHKNINEINGLIVTKSYPPINSYKDVEIIGFQEIKNL